MASYYDEECSAKMVTAYVTDDEGYSAIVSMYTHLATQQFHVLITILLKNRGDLCSLPK